jgi:nucleoside phosphorylase
LNLQLYKDLRMDKKTLGLLQEVQRQLEIPLQTSEQTYGSANSGVTKTQQVAQSYRIELAQLREYLSGLCYFNPLWYDTYLYRTGSIAGQMPLPSDSPPVIQLCLWGIPALCRSPSIILDPIYLKQECLQLQGACGFTRQETDTNDIWESQQLHDWARVERSSLLMIQGSYGSVNRLKRFSAEVYEYLNGKQPTIAMFHSPSSSDFFDSFGEQELLRQLALQALQRVPVDHPVSFLAEMLQHFLKASTCKDWFSILENIFQVFPSLIVIVVVSVLGERAENARAWPGYLEKTIARLQESSSTCLRVLLIATSPLWSTSDASPLLLVGPAPRMDPDYNVSGIFDVPREHNLPIHLPIRNQGGLEEVQSLESAQGETIQNEIVPGIPAQKTYKQARPNSNRLTSLPINRPRIEIAILCALPLEADAVETLFDEQWSGGYNRSEGDKNTYSFGVIGRHGVALVHMPGMGTCYAAIVAAYCGATFPNISLALVVGICGGVPFTQDGTELLLGDVAISEGLVRYDFGRQYPDGFVRKNSVSESARKPPAEILGYLAKLKGVSARKRLRERTASHLATLRQENKAVATYPGIEKDILFESAYRHKHQDSLCVICGCSDNSTGIICEQARSSNCKELMCDNGRSIPRRRQKEVQDKPGQHKQSYPAVHFGKFASGDRVMKSGEDRDRIACREGIIAFEMEGAGAWDILPCVIIKGICDYSDSHKDKWWQEYAAITAAACTKTFLEGWRQ